MLDVASLLDDGAIGLPDFSPSAVEMVGSVPEGILRGELLIHFNPPPRQLAGPQITIFISCAARKDLGGHIADNATLLDAEV